MEKVNNKKLRKCLSSEKLSLFVLKQPTAVS
jgi:hypothetical protein